MYNQPLVIRAFFNSQTEMDMASEQLDQIGAWNDVIAGSKTDPHPYKIIFTDTSMVQAKVCLRRISVKSALVQVFDPQDVNNEGWAEFRTIGL